MSAHTMPNANFKSFQKPVHVSMRLALLSRFTFPGHTVLCLHLVYAIEGQNVSRLGRKFRKIGIFTTFLPTPGPNGAKARAQGVQGMEVMRQLQETPPSTTTVEPFIKRASPLATYSLSLIHSSRLSVATAAITGAPARAPRWWPSSRPQAPR